MNITKSRIKECKKIVVCLNNRHYLTEDEIVEITKHSKEWVVANLGFLMDLGIVRVCKFSTGFKYKLNL